MKQLLLISFLALATITEAQFKLRTNCDAYKSYTRKDLECKFRNDNSYVQGNSEFIHKGIKELTRYDCINNELIFKQQFDKNGAMLTNISYKAGDTVLTQRKLVDSLAIYEHYVNGELDEVDTFVLDTKGKPTVIKNQTKHSYIQYDSKNRPVFQKDSSFYRAVSEQVFSYFQDSIIVKTHIRAKRQHTTRTKSYYFNKKDQIIKSYESEVIIRHRKDSVQTEINNYEIKYQYNKQHQHIASEAINSAYNLSYSYKRTYHKNKLIKELLYENGTLVDITQYEYPKADSLHYTHVHILSPESQCIDYVTFYNINGKARDIIYEQGSTQIKISENKDGWLTRKDIYKVVNTGEKVLKNSIKNIIEKY